MRLKAALPFFLVLVLLSGCISTAAPPPAVSLVEATQAISTPQSADAGQQKTIALVMKTLTNPFFQEMEKGARKAAAELNLNLIVKTAAQETSIEQQIAIVEELVRDDVDAIVIAPGDSRELIPALKKAQDAGIVVVNIDNRLDSDLSSKLGLVSIPVISVNNEQGAYLSAKAISDMITTPSEAVILQGILDARNAQDRAAGAVRAFAENKNIEVVASETANWKIDEAYQVIGNLYKRYPDISVIFCANDMMALGVLKYLDETHKTDVLVAGFDNLPEVQASLREGKLKATIDQQAAEQGYQGVMSAVHLLNGEKVNLDTIIDVMLITPGSLK
jgi:ribose transport system substrate-binding protein